MEHEVQFYEQSLTNSFNQTTLILNDRATFVFTSRPPQLQPLPTGTSPRPRPRLPSPPTYPLSFPSRASPYRLANGLTPPSSCPSSPAGGGGRSGAERGAPGVAGNPQEEEDEEGRGGSGGGSGGRGRRRSRARAGVKRSEGGAQLSTLHMNARFVDGGLRGKGLFSFDRAEERNIGAITVDGGAKRNDSLVPKQRNPSANRWLHEERKKG